LVERIKEQAKSPVDYTEGWAKELLANYQNGLKGTAAASNHAPDNLSGIFFFPFLALRNDVEELAKASREQVGYLFRSQESADMAELFARATFLVLHNDERPKEALAAAVASVPAHAERIKKGLASGAANEDDATVGKLHGLSCSLNSGIPIVAHLVSKYDTDEYRKDPKKQLESVLLANKLIGGESGTRAQLLAALFTAQKSSTEDIVPSRWWDGLKKKDQIQAAIDKLLS